MASVVTFPNPCLVAVILVCNTRIGSGSQILFRYPPQPVADDDAQSIVSSIDDGLGDSSSTDSEDSSTDENNDVVQSTTSKTASKPNHDLASGKTAVEDDRASVTTSSGPNSTRKPAFDSLFGFAEDGLVSLLSPDRTWHKRKFELSINDLTFVGRPVFVRPDGSWRKGKVRTKKKLDGDHSASDTPTDLDGPVDADDPRKPRSAPSDQSGHTSRSPLTMFHVVFVMRTPALEHSLRVKDMYDHVIRKFSRALKWEQGHNDYVWKEAETIATIKTAALAHRSSSSSLCAEILKKSSLALALSTVFIAISNSRIASVTLSPKVKFSLQIPPVTSTSYLPSLTDPPIQAGLWLTTATEIGSTGLDAEETNSTSATQMAKHYTLLLKSPPHRIAKDALDAGGPLAAHLPKFVSSLRPTKSFHKLSVSSHISLADIQLFAHHLIYWRRAVAIPPLHQKDVYIVSPNADLRKLREATLSYEQQFATVAPNMPSLPKILSALSGIPRPFGTLIPSTDHKEIYYLALAWLMRNGWVTQLRTFMYVRVDARVKRAVREKERDMNPRNFGRSKPQKDDYNTGKDVHRTRHRPSVISRASSDGKRSADDNWPKHNPRMASLILNPPRASPVESAWLAAIEDFLTSNDTNPSGLSREERVEIKKYWPLFLKYFNGQIAIETVPVREGLKRRFVWSLLSKAGLDLERGVEHPNGASRSVLVAFRHW